MHATLGRLGVLLLLAILVTAASAQPVPVPGDKAADPTATQQKLLAKAHQRGRRQRQDFHHKTALALVRQYDTVYHEDLRVANLVRNHHLAKSIQDAGWSVFLTILTFKAASAGKRVQAVEPAYTSQTCSGCGVVVSQGLSVRWHRCPECGTSLHGDHNAARNIEGRGQRLRGEAGLLASQNREPAGL